MGAVFLDVNFVGRLGYIATEVLLIGEKSLCVFFKIFLFIDKIGKKIRQ